MNAFEAEQEIKGMIGSALAQNTIYWAKKAKDPKASKKDKAFARKQLDASLPRSIEDLYKMAGLKF